MSSDNNLYLVIVPSPPPDTNYYANDFEDSALNTNLLIKVTAIDIFSLLTYLSEFRVKYIISALASSLEI